jgi:hypothetical protein
MMTTLEDRERQMIQEALAQTRGRISGPTGAAAKLGIRRHLLPDSSVLHRNLSARKGSINLPVVVPGTLTEHFGPIPFGGQERG